MDDAVTLMQQLGFSEYEARAYLALLQRNPLNGYELAKASGLPRANIYAVLQKLEERGAVVRLDMPNGARYAPVSPNQLTQRIGSRFQEALGAAQRTLENLAIAVEPEYVWNIRGYAALLDHAHTLIDAAQESLHIALMRQEASALGEPLARAETRGVKLITLCMDECPQDCGNCRGTICRYCTVLAAEQRWLMLVSDDAEVLTGEIGSDNDVLAIRTRQRLQIDLTNWHMRHSMILTAMLRDLNNRPDDVLAPETQVLLRSVDPGNRQGGWLNHMRALLRR